ncbi:MAG: 50S ribosomal protein L9 [Candidatus Omnitrophota bacterium]
MKVILKQDVERIGKAGGIIKVKDGFARNFLFPKKLAVPVNTANLKQIEGDSQRKLQQSEKIKNEAREIKEKLNNLSLTIPVLIQEDETLYGSITSQEIESVLKEEGFEINKNSILLESPIKALGVYEISVKLHPEVMAKVKIWIVKK